MKIIDCSAVKENVHSSDSLTDWLATLKIGRGSSQDLEAQETAINVFQRLIDNKFFLLQNVSIQGLEMPIPMVLIGSTGIWVIYPSGLRGVFRARGDSWEKIDDRHQSYAPTGENLLTRTSVMSSAVESNLIASGIQAVQIEPVLVFTNPGIHVETIRPIIRVVLVDALERFASGVVQGRILYDSDQVQHIVDVLVSPDKIENAGQVQLSEIENGSTDTPGTATHRKIPGSDSLDRFDNTFAKLDKMPFSSRQWLILGIIMLVNIVILAGFVIYILIAT